MANDDFTAQMQGYGLTTVQIHYYLPDHPSLLQMFAFQQYDLAPRFPRLHGFQALHPDIDIDHERVHRKFYVPLSKVDAPEFSETLS